MALDVMASAVFALVVGAVLWPPGAVYWTAVAAVTGTPVALAAVALLAVALGAGFVARTSVAPGSFVVGTVVAYTVGMVAVGAVLSPSSPVHILGYAVLACCLVAGATLAGRRDW